MKNETVCDICGFAINGAILGSSDVPRQACAQCWDHVLIEQANHIFIEQDKKTRLACIEAIQRRFSKSEGAEEYDRGLESALEAIRNLDSQTHHSINVDGSCNLGCC